MRRNKEEAEQTKNEVMDVATKLFTEQGYQNVSLEMIAEQVGVTRGALYHHFKNKKGLFEAVFNRSHEQIGQQIEQVDLISDDLWFQLIEGCKLFMQASSNQSAYRILLVDGPAVLGWEAFRRMDQANSMTLLREQLELLQEQQILKPTPVVPLTHALSAAMNELSIWIGEQENQAEALSVAVEIIEGMLEGYKTI